MKKEDVKKTNFTIGVAPLGELLGPADFAEVMKEGIGVFGFKKVVDKKLSGGA